jgi:serine/threonine protein kinase
MIKNKVKKVGNYMIGNQIGKGSFGDVRLATHIPTGCTVAIKIIVKENIKDGLDFKRIE